MAGAAVDSTAFCANASLLVETEPLAGPVVLDFASIAIEITSRVQPAGAVIESVKYLVASSCALVGQLLALIEPVPAAAIRAGERLMLEATAPGALDIATVEVCVPGSPARLQVASTPENAIVQLPVDIVEFVHTAPTQV